MSATFSWGSDNDVKGSTIDVNATDLWLPDSATDADIAQIAQLCPRLQTLILGGCKQVTDAGLKHVGRMQRLRTLTLESCDITDAGLAHLADLPQLRKLDLGDNKISDRGLLYLVESSQVAALDVSAGRTFITSRGWRAWQLARSQPSRHATSAAAVAAARALASQSVPTPASERPLCCRSAAVAAACAAAATSARAPAVAAAAVHPILIHAAAVIRIAAFASRSVDRAMILGGTTSAWHEALQPWMFWEQQIKYIDEQHPGRNVRVADLWDLPAAMRTQIQLSRYLRPILVAAGAINADGSEGGEMGGYEKTRAQILSVLHILPPLLPQIERLLSGRLAAVLRVAARYDMWPLVDMLLLSRENPLDADECPLNDVLSSNWTALHEACRHLSVNAIRSLVLAGADRGRVCSDIPVPSCSFQSERYFANRDRGRPHVRNSLHIVCSSNSRDTQRREAALRALLEPAANFSRISPFVINYSTDDEGFTPLEVLVRSEHATVESLQLLLNHGANPCQRLGDSSALMVAIRHGRTSLVECLLHAIRMRIKKERVVKNGQTRKLLDICDDLRKTAAQIAEYKRMIRDRMTHEQKTLAALKCECDCQHFGCEHEPNQEEEQEEAQEEETEVT